MKNLFIALLILPFIFSCNSKDNKQNSSKIEVLNEDNFEYDSIKSIEDELYDNAIGGEGVVFENGKMSFSIEALESSAQKVEQQLNDIKINNNYESEDLKKNAIESMELNLKLFQGIFCCTTHDEKHCTDSKELMTLKDKYGCDRFMKKE